MISKMQIVLLLILIMVSVSALADQEKILISPFCLSKLKFIVNTAKSLDAGVPIEELRTYEKDVMQKKLETAGVENVELIMAERIRLIEIIYGNVITKDNIEEFFRDEVNLCMINGF